MDKTTLAERLEALAEKFGLMYDDLDTVTEAARAVREAGAESANLPIEWNEAAARSAANEVIRQLDQRRCDSSHVSDCLRCNALYLARRTLALLDTNQ